MKTYRVTDVLGYFGLFIDDEIEAEDETDAKEQVMMEICDNIGNYIDIEVEEIIEEEEEEEEEEEDISEEK
jgi:hypothetical protein